MIALCFGFIGKISALISSVPSAVMGGVSFLLFGIIASSGLRMLIDNKIDYENNRNLIITSVILVIGVEAHLSKCLKEDSKCQGWRLPQLSVSS